MRQYSSRTQLATDRRSHALFLTPDGEKAFAQVKDLARQHETHVIERIGAQRYELLMQMLKEIERVP